jgi:hypothetical protein
MEKDLEIKEVCGMYYGLIKANVGTEKRCILRNKDAKELVREAQEENPAFEFRISFMESQNMKLYPSKDSLFIKSPLI